MPNHYVTGSAIRRLREKRKLTQAQLAAALSVSDKNSFQMGRQPGACRTSRYWSRWPGRCRFPYRNCSPVKR